jgi:hypothetical protein
VEILLIAVVALAVKLPLAWCCWNIYRAIHDVPEIEIDREGGEFVRAQFRSGPRTRGPHGGPPGIAAEARRGDKGHDPTAPERRVGSGRTAV